MEPAARYARVSAEHRRSIENVACPLLAQSGHSTTEFQCPLLGVKRTSEECAAMSAFDPKRTLTAQDCCRAKITPEPHFAGRKFLM